MLFTYSQINDPIFEIQKQLDFLFNDVWIVAEGTFDADKLNGNAELKQIYIDFGNVDYDPNDPTKKESKGKTAYFFNSSIEKIFKCFADIDDDVFKDKLKQQYINNNSIESLCNDKSLIPITYDDITSVHPNLSKELHSFYYSLYGNSSPYNLKALGNLSKKLLPDYDNAFMKVNTQEICPFCGINLLKGNNHTYKEAYDHYLPKAVYPFNSLNFKNLAPMCHECNSTYKLAKFPIYNGNPKKINPLFRETLRENSFYPYSKKHPELNFKIELKTKDLKNIKPMDLEIKVNASKMDEKINSWKRVFGIDERYKGLICSKNGGVSWLDLVYDDFENASVLGKVLSPNNYYKMKMRETMVAPYTDYGFIKGPFLEECRKSGVIPNVWRNWLEQYPIFHIFFKKGYGK